MQFDQPVTAPDPDQAPNPTTATATLDPARLFPSNRGGWTTDGAWAVESITRGRVDVTRARDGRVLEYVDTTVAGALRAIATGWVDTELTAQDTRRATPLAQAS